MKVVQIGNQSWTAENLSVSHYRNGNPIPEVQDREEWINMKSGAWCYYNNDPQYGSEHGKIYNWYAVIDSRGLAPDGFKIPTYYDWLKLKENLGEGGGRKLKFPRAWNELNGDPEPIDYNFNARPSGYRNHGSFLYLNYFVGWWAHPINHISFPVFVKGAHFFLLQNESPLRWKPGGFNNDGYYVRCLKQDYKTITLYFDDNLKVAETEITMKYSDDMIFQDLLNLIYSKYLKEKVEPYSYGREWAIYNYDLMVLKPVVKNSNNSQKIEDVFGDLMNPLKDTCYIVRRPW